MFMCCYVNGHGLLFYKGCGRIMVYKSKPVINIHGGIKWGISFAGKCVAELETHICIDKV